ncbi:GNAT family N-acetyltransferase [Neobacillus niacini]|uniref:GNAT family N-acetyltransferase n=1 Tax=Neobacillus niacini TaxID=86668 RepID=UPI0021CB5148|nr:GNAT family N-acetyltransferase [Neobacillus niacini]MCM3765625.1 GNAT family N-acetyltransferase [Neobacillus niacini]
MTCAIQHVKESEVLKVNQFVREAISKSFSFPLTEKNFRDLENFKERYISNNRNGFFAAFDYNNEIVGTIAFVQYDNRITSLKNKYDLNVTCEIVRCYVREDKRREGIGTLLFDKVKDAAKNCNYTTLYLHSHKCLPGGIDFWLAKGFNRVLDEQDEYETVHMELNIG